MQIEKNKIENLKSLYKTQSLQAQTLRKRSSFLWAAARAETNPELKQNLVDQANRFYRQFKSTTKERRQLYLAYCFAKGKSFDHCGSPNFDKFEIAWILGDQKFCEDVVVWRDCPYLTKYTLEVYKKARKELEDAYHKMKSFERLKESAVKTFCRWTQTMLNPAVISIAEELALADKQRIEAGERLEELKEKLKQRNFRLPVEPATHPDSALQMPPSETQT
jgi:hypothetical protein